MSNCTDCNADLPPNSRRSRCAVCSLGFEMRTVHLEIRNLVKQQNRLLAAQTQCLEFLCQCIKDEQSRRG
jgi:hypothetical protein